MTYKTAFKFFLLQYWHSNTQGNFYSNYRANTHSLNIYLKKNLYYAV